MHSCTYGGGALCARHLGYTYGGLAGVFMGGLAGRPRGGRREASGGGEGGSTRSWVWICIGTWCGLQTGIWSGGTGVLGGGCDVRFHTSCNERAHALLCDVVLQPDPLFPPFSNLSLVPPQQPQPSSPPWLHPYSTLLHASSMLLPSSSPISLFYISYCSPGP